MFWMSAARNAGSATFTRMYVVRAWRTSRSPFSQSATSAQVHSGPDLGSTFRAYSFAYLGGSVSRNSGGIAAMNAELGRSASAPFCPAFRTVDEHRPVLGRCHRCDEIMTRGRERDKQRRRQCKCRAFR
jgi:hypothetical protein